MAEIWGIVSSKESDLGAAVPAATSAHAPGRIARRRGEPLAGLPSGWFGIEAAAGGKRPPARLVHQEQQRPKLTLAFSGLLTNLEDLCRELGAPAKARPDASGVGALICRAYLRWGLRFLEHLEGRWALALHDPLDARVLLAVDPLAGRPLHYAIADGRLVFGESLPLVLRRQGLRREEDWSRIADFLTHAGAYVDCASQTFFRGVHRLPPGCLAVLDQRGFRVAPWWELDPWRCLPFSEETPCLVAERIRQVVAAHRERLQRACFALSGGLDSTSLLFLSAELLDAPPVTISLWNEHFLLDERRYAELAVRESGARSLRVIPTPERIVEEIERLFELHPEPVPSPTWFGHYLLLRRAAEDGFPTIFLGHGLDEAAGGYAHHYSFRLGDLLQQGRQREFQAELVHWSRLFWGTEALLREFLARHVRDGRPNHDADALPDHQAQQLFTPELLARRRGVPTLRQPWPTLLKNSLHRDLRRDSLPPFLARERVHCAALGVEAIAPFCDTRLIELLFSLPDEFLIRHGEPKYIIRRAMEPVIPRAIRLRTAKIGINVPYSDWFDGPLRPLFQELPHDPALQELGIVNPVGLEELLRNPDLGQKFLLWRILALVRWWRTHVAG